MNSTMFNAGDILETIRMIQDECLDIRTTTMGISLLDCIDPDINKACDKVYDKITRKAEKLVETGEKIEKEYGIPIINKRIAVTPIAMLAAACPKDSPVKFAKALQRAAETCGVNFVGGYSALVHKGFSAGDLELIRSIPEALDVTTRLCSSVNVGSTRSGINMDAVRIMGDIVLESAKLTADRQCVGPSKLVIFCNAPEDNPFMAGACVYRSDCRHHQENRIQDHSNGSAGWRKSISDAGRSFWYRRPFSGTDTGCRRQCCTYPGGNGSGNLRHTRHNSCSGSAE